MDKPLTGQELRAKALKDASDSVQLYAALRISNAEWEEIAQLKAAAEKPDKEKSGTSVR